MLLIIPGFEDQPIVPPGGLPSGGFEAGGIGNTILANILNMLFVIAVILVLLFIIWGGVQWITSEGDKQKVAAARSRIIYSIIGLVIIALSIPIVNLFLFFFGGPELGK